MSVKKMFPIFIFILISNGIMFSRSDALMSSVCRLTDQDKDPLDWQLLLPKGYSSTSPPPPPTPDAKEPISVFNSIEILDIDDVDEDEMAFKLQFFLMSAWEDTRLDTKSMVEGADGKKGRLLLPEESFPCFWIPSIIFDNDKEEKLFRLTFVNSKMTLFANKTLIRVSRLSIKIRCLINLAMYPMDRQVCHFRMRLLDQSNSEVKLFWTNATNSPFKSLNNGSLTFDEKSVSPSAYKMGPIIISNRTRTWMNEEYTYLCIRFPFIRRITPSVVTIYIPSSLTVIVSWVTFWIDLDCPPARVTLGFMSILTIITQILEVRKILPPVNYLTAIDIWLFVCLCFCFLSLAEYAFAYTLFRKIKKQAKKDEEIRWADVLPHPGRMIAAMSASGRRRSFASEEDGVVTNISHHNNNNSNNHNLLSTTNHVNHTHNTHSSRTLTNGVIVTNPINNNIVTNHITDMVSAIKNAIKPKRNQSIYDENSKTLFPITFFTFAIGYWSYYQLTRYNSGSSDCDFD